MSEELTEKGTNVDKDISVGRWELSQELKNDKLRIGIQHNTGDLKSYVTVITLQL